jgi:hypothetical protein
MTSEEVRGSFCHDDSCVMTDQLATGPDALERELLMDRPAPTPSGSACSGRETWRGACNWRLKYIPNQPVRVCVMITYP